MSVFSYQIEENIQTVIDASWNIREGRVVPETDDVALRNGAVQLEATYLYADLANSSVMAHRLYKPVAAKIIRTFLDAASRIVKHFEGEIRGFDGDRVMGIFIGNSKNMNAVKAALGINWAVQEVLRPKVYAKWNDISDLPIGQGVGVATGEALIVRGGVRNDNDLISIGEAPNVAAKLSALRGWQDTYITEDVYDVIHADAKYSDDVDMWSQYPAQNIGGKVYGVKASGYWWRP